MNNPESSPGVLRAILLDSGPLSLAANPKSSPAGAACNQWLEAKIFDGVRIYIPEIADYEVRRELLQARLIRSVTALDKFVNTFDFLPLNTSVMRQAAQLWAQARQSGLPTADRHALDGDVILAAQALSLQIGELEFCVATTNVGHLTRFVPAKLWQEM